MPATLAKSPAKSKAAPTTKTEAIAAAVDRFHAAEAKFKATRARVPEWNNACDRACSALNNAAQSLARKLERAGVRAAKVGGNLYVISYDCGDEPIIVIPTKEVLKAR